MRIHRCAGKLALGALAIAIVLTASQSSYGWGGSWGGGGFGSRGFAGGSWGVRGGFRTPVRDFFAYRQPVRNLFRGIAGLGRRGYGWGSYGGYGSAGLGSVGYGSAGYGSAGYSSVSYGSVGYGSGGVAVGSVGGYGSAGYQYYSSASSYGGAMYGGSAGFVSAPVATSYSVGAVAPAVSSCPDCVGTVQPGTIHSGTIYDNSVPSAAPYSGDSTIGGNMGTYDSGVIYGEPYYDSGSVVPGDSSGAGQGTQTPPIPEPANGDETTATPRVGSGILNVSVPSDAKVYVNDRLTTTPGDSRSYVSRNLEAGRNYRFEIRASIVRDGREISLERNVVMRSGRSEFVKFDFDNPVMTQLTVKVPEDAKVELCGNATKASGSLRSFKTAMMPGQIWENYDIQVQFQQDGKIVNRQKSITIKAGQQYVVDFESGSSVNMIASK